MKTALSPLRVIRPQNLAEALRVMGEGPCTLFAGCTDVFVELHFGLRKTTDPKTLLDLWPLQELRGISVQGETLVIGALTTYTDIMRAPDVQQRIPMLARAASEIGGVQIQNRGTIGGNVGNGSPAGDTLPVLAVADATVVLRSATQERRVPFNQFYHGYRQSVRQPDELIAAIEIPRVEGKQWFRKVGTRAAQAISKIVAAGVRGTAPAFALGSVAPTVVRLPQTEAALRAGDIKAAQQALMQEITPIDDIRSNAAYRRQVAQNLLAEFWHATH